MNEKILFRVLEDDILNIRIGKINNNKGFSVIRKANVLREFDINELRERLYEKIGNDYSIVYDSNMETFSIINERIGKQILSSKSNFTFTNGNEKGVRFSFSEDEVIFGLGQDHMANLFNRNVERRSWHQWNGYDRVGNNTVPFYLSSNGYGLFVDTSYPVRLVFGKPKIPPKVVGYELTPAPYKWDIPACESQDDTISLLVYEDKIVDIWILLGEYGEVVKKYYNLTGFPKILPKWAYGFIQCKNRYKSAEEILRIAKKFREKKIPCDCIVIDWMWFKEFGDLEWDERYFSNIEDVLREINSLGIQVMQAQHPFVEKASLKYEKFRNEGCIVDVPEGARPIFDHSHPKAKQLWWSEIRKFFKQGIRGYWTDMGEPEFDWPGAKAYLGSREKYHNIYTLLWSKNLYEAQTEEFNIRPFILARTMYLGIQNYSTALWSGDIFASWDVLKDNVIIGQNVSISGQPYFCTDIGGFHTDSRFTPELYVRWMEWGIFNGIFRTHGTKPENEPWSFGSQFENIIVDLIKFRYRLVPYVYSFAKKMSLNGINLVRPCFFDFRDRELLNYPYQYLFGDLLVSPVVEEGKRTKETYLPNGIWFNYYTGEKYKGPLTLLEPAPLETIPIYVPNGTIIVESDGNEESTKDVYENYVVKVYGSAESTQIIYEDDGNTFDYEKGIYNEIFIKVGFDSSEPFLLIKTNVMNYRKDIPLRKLKIMWFFDKDEKYYCEVNYTLGEERIIKIRDMEKIFTESSDISVYVDNANKKYNGDEFVNILIHAVDFKPRKMRLVIQQPKFYFSDKPLEFNIEFSKIFQTTLKFSPNSAFLPQFEDVNWWLYDEDMSEIKSGKIRLGNEHVRNWCIKVAKPHEKVGPEMYYSRGHDNNPFGYVKLLDYLNAKYLGFVPVDFIDIKIKEGIGAARTKLLSPSEKEVFLKIKGEKSIKLILNGQIIFISSDFVTEEVVKAHLKVGINFLDVVSKFDSSRPWTGREFGFSVQILNEDGEIDDSIISIMNEENINLEEITTE